MPIVIEEVMITVEVENQGAGAAPAGPAGGGAMAPADRQALLAECVERVLQILADREEP